MARHSRWAIVMVAVPTLLLAACTSGHDQTVPTQPTTEAPIAHHATGTLTGIAIPCGMYKAGTPHPPIAINVFGTMDHRGRSRVYGFGWCSFRILVPAGDYRVSSPEYGNLPPVAVSLSASQTAHVVLPSCK